MTTDQSTQTDYATLARLLRPQGRRGELLADLLTDLTEQLGEGRRVFLVGPNANAPTAHAERIEIQSHWLPVGKNAGRIVIKLAGCDSINDAEKFAGFKLMIPAAERPALDAETYYITDLVGCTLYNGETPVGEVIDVEFAMTPDGKQRLADAAPLLCVQPEGTEDEDDIALVPFVKAMLRSVDIQAAKIVMDIPEGLFEAGDLEDEDSGEEEED